MTCRVEKGVTYKQAYNAENRISSIQKITEGTCANPTKLASGDCDTPGLFASRFQLFHLAHSVFHLSFWL
jgi:hypothetical protein